MVARISCLALVVGFLVGCYDIPQPECGFACGPAGACPSDYSCNSAVNRCELIGSSPSCESALDAGTDSRPDSQDDFIAPTVVDRLPAPSQTGVPITTMVGATFSEPVLSGTVNGNSFRVLSSSNVLVQGPVNYEPTTFTAFFVPSALLDPSTTYTVFVTTEIVDLVGNPLAITDFWHFTTADDTTPPMVTTRTPAVGATGVSVGSSVFVEFSENVTGVSNTSVTLRDGVTPVPANVTYSMNPPRATLSPMTQLAANTTYTVSIGSPIADAAANPIAPLSWTFTTGVDALSPNVVTRTPIPASAGVPVTTIVIASFDEDVINVSTTSFTLTPPVGAPVAATVGYTSATRTATLTPSVQLTANTQYTVDLTSAITDADANALTPESWTFTTGDDLAGPNVLTRLPAPASTGVSVIPIVSVVFDEDVLNATAASFTLTPLAGSPIAATVAYTSATRTAILTPDLQLTANTLYTATLTTAITDLAANALSTVSWVFTTGADLLGPRVVLTTPVDLATAVSVASTIVVRFDEPVQNVTNASFTVNGGAITGTFVLSAGGTIVTFTPDAALPASATITVNLTTAIADAIANPLAAPVMFSFTTAP